MSVMVITGGTAGAGKATALRFARAGYHVALIARDETGLQETRQACERFGIKTLAISADVVDAGALQRAAAEVETLSLIHISEPTRLGMISYAVFCLKKKKTKRPRSRRCIHTSKT